MLVPLLAQASFPFVYFAVGTGGSASEDAFSIALNWNNDTGNPDTLASVYNNSWGVPDGVLFDQPTIGLAIENGQKNGRDELGSIFVFLPVMIGTLEMKMN